MVAGFTRWLADQPRWLVRLVNGALAIASVLLDGWALMMLVGVAYYMWWHAVPTIG